MPAAEPRRTDDGRPSLLRCVEHAGDDVCTIFCKDIAVGGLLLADGDCWLWAIFVASEGEAGSGDDQPLAGVALTKDLAYAAFEQRWTDWLEAKGTTWRPRFMTH